jgi:hypothetical protein
MDAISTADASNRGRIVGHIVGIELMLRRRFPFLSSSFKRDHRCMPPVASMILGTRSRTHLHALC